MPRHYGGGPWGPGAFPHHHSWTGDSPWCYEGGCGGWHHMHHHHTHHFEEMPGRMMGKMMGRGFRGGGSADYGYRGNDRQDEERSLQEEMHFLEDRLKEVKDRLDDLKRRDRTHGYE